MPKQTNKNGSGRDRQNVNGKKKSPPPLAVKAKLVKMPKTDPILPARDRHQLAPTFEFKYSPAPEATDFVKIEARQQLFIDGKFVAPRSGQYFPSINPAKSEKICEIAEIGRAHV